MHRDGNSWRAIEIELKVKRSTAQKICKEPSSRTTCKGKVYHKRLIDKRTIHQLLREISCDYPSHRLSFEQVRRRLNLTVSAHTIQRELRRAGYRRCISCPRLYISRAQAKKRLNFAYSRRWWGTSDYAAHRAGGGDWRMVIWSDEATFEVGKSGRIWITRRVDEKACPSCIRSIYRLGRFSVMI
jgi:hypothetical protein